MMCALELLPRLTPGSARVNIVKTVPAGQGFHDTTNYQHCLLRYLRVGFIIVLRTRNIFSTRYLLQAALWYYCKYTDQHQQYYNL